MHKRLFTTVLIFFIVINFLNGQKLVNSPYARFNLGTLNQPGSFRSLSMGGIITAMSDNNTISFANPASYTSFDTTSFIFDMGLDLTTLKLTGSDINSFTTTDINFRHILLGFPLSKKIGVAAGLVPFSNGYYYIAEKITQGHPEWNELTGDYISIHKGSGSLTTLFAGTGIEITKNISFGINLNILFGSLKRQNQIELSDYQTTFSLNNVENLNISGFNLDYGIQYRKSLKKNFFVNAGISYMAPKNYSSTHEMLKQRNTVYYYPPYAPDTLASYIFTSTDSTRFPGSLRAGIIFGKKDKFIAGIDYVMTEWSNAKIHGSVPMTGNTRSLMFGIEYIPEKYSNTSFLKRIEYRVGARISDNYLVLNGVQLKEFSLTGGFAIRLKNSISKATVYLDYTRRTGDISRGLHNEEIFSAGLSLNLYDFWFRKRQYD